MAEIVRMPKLSDTMSEGVVAKWHKKIGDKVKSGDLLADIETDKATMEFESFDDGVLLHQGVKEGETAAVDSILAILGKEGEDISSLLEGGEEKPATKDNQKKKAEDTEEDKDAAGEKESDVKKSSAENEPKKESEDKSESRKTVSDRLVASPLAKSLAKDKGIDISDVTGSGEGGRIIKRDIENYTPAAKQATQSASTSGEESYDEVPVSQMRKTIARRLAESKFSAPHFYLTMDIDMDNAIAARTSINEFGGSKVSFNDFVVKSVALALKKHPKVNASWLGDKIRYNHHVHIGVAVAVEDGLVVPVVKFADGKSLTEINGEVKNFAAKAREKKIQPADMQGNTFTISNLGMYGIEQFTAIINSPDSCIMAVGAIRQEPVVKNGVIVVGNRMKVTLSCDHRSVDGATGSEFLLTFKQLLENPVLMI
jgi:pyruvate dehydrogenase E2 component (dihydrolipoamide acetyltransferase)